MLTAEGTWNEFFIPNKEQYEPFNVVNYGSSKNELQQLHYSIPKSDNSKNSFPVFIWFHGGSLQLDERQIPSAVYNGSFVVVECRYRVYPDATPYDAIRDSKQAVDWVFSNLEKLKGDKDKVFVGGFSAGAYLSAMIGFAKGSEFYCDHKIAGLVLVSGQMSTHFLIKQIDLEKYHNKEYVPVVDEFAPLNYVTKDMRPAIFITGEATLEMPARTDENALMASSLKAAGNSSVRHVIIQGHKHIEVVRACGSHILKFIESILKKK